MALCENPVELTVTLPEKTGNDMFYCPVLLSKGHEIPYADPRFVVCKHLEECRAKRASDLNHDTSAKNTNYRARPATTATEVNTDGFPLATYRKNYYRDPLLALSAKRKSEDKL